MVVTAGAAPAFLHQARAIVWAQWRTVFNFYPRSNPWSTGLSALLAAAWYGGWLFSAWTAARTLALVPDRASAETLLKYGLTLGFFYWQVVPLMLASAGASLEVKKLIVYPVPHGQLFLLDVILRITTGIEVLVLMAGAGIGLARNPHIFFAAPLVFLPYAAFNMFVAAGARDLISRLMARRYLRELLVFSTVLLGALPQLLVLSGPSLSQYPIVRQLPALASAAKQASLFLPWSPVAHLASGQFSALTFALLCCWTAAGWYFGRRQFERGLRFDAAAAQSAPRPAAPPARWSEVLFSLPARIFPDPMAAIIEKELRSLVRTPRFRLIFFMGLSFGLLMWLPMLLRSGPGPGPGGGSSPGFFRDNYLAFVAVYALLLLGEVCLWNIFGFDRSATQAYFVCPVRLRTAIVAKNIVALFFVLLEVSLIALVCVVFRLPMPMTKAVPAYLICTLTTILLMAAGNLTSVYFPRAMTPSTTMRSRPPAKTQGLLMLIFLVASMLGGLAYLAEYAFDTPAAFYIVIAILGFVASATYWVSLDTAVQAAFDRRELLISALSQNESPVSA